MFELTSLFTFTVLGFSTSPGHGTIECKPKGLANKGTAVEMILEHHFGKSWKDEVMAIYIGDDTTDEDAMKALKGKGVSVRIFEGQPAGKTEADLIFNSTRSVVHFFSWLLGKLE